MKTTTFQQLSIGARFEDARVGITSRNVAYYRKFSRDQYMIVYHNVEEFSPMVCNAWGGDFLVRVLEKESRLPTWV